VNLTSAKWTVIAESRPGVYGSRDWRYEAGVNGKDVRLASDAGTVIIMHRRAGEGDKWQLVARFACPAWGKIQRALAKTPVVLPQVRRYRA
jgi:hypothetical protein